MRATQRQDCLTSLESNQGLRDSGSGDLGGGGGGGGSGGDGGDGGGDGGNDGGDGGLSEVDNEIWDF